MNTTLCIRRCAASLLLIVGVGLAIPAHARPADPNWRPQVGKSPELRQACDKVWKLAGFGPGTGNKAIWVVERDLGPCAKAGDERRIMNYAGPRSTVPVYERGAP